MRWIPSAVMFATRETYHTTLQATPAQLVFGRDAILNVQFEANWNFIKENKQRLIHLNILRKNSKRIASKYKQGDKVLFKNRKQAKYGQDPYSGPYTIVHVNDNGTVKLKMGVVTDTVNIRLIKPYHD